MRQPLNHMLPLRAKRCK